MEEILLNNDPLEEDQLTQQAPESPQSNPVLEQLYSLGIIDPEIAKPEDFSIEKLPELVQVQKETLKQKALEEFINSLDPQIASFVKLAATQNISLEDYLTEYANPSYNLEIEEHQEAALKHYLSVSTSLPEEKINRYIQNLKSNNELKEEAEEALIKLSELYEQRREEAIKQQEEELAALQRKQEEYIKSVEDALSSAEIHPSRKNKIKDYLFTPVRYENQNTTRFNLAIQNIAQNPQHLVQLADIIADYDPKKGFKINRKNDSSSIKQLEEALMSSSKPKQSATQQSKSESSFFEQWLNR